MASIHIPQYPILAHDASLHKATIKISNELELQEGESDGLVKHCQVAGTTEGNQIRYRLAFEAMMQGESELWLFGEDGRKLGGARRKAESC